MATSESDDFESADEELNARSERVNRGKKYNSIGSDSDDDVDYIPVQYHTPMKRSSRGESKTPNRRNKSAYEQHKTSGMLYGYFYLSLQLKMTYNWNNFILQQVKTQQKPKQFLIIVR